jgi:O-succinylbenzoate synthase
VYIEILGWEVLLLDVPMTRPFVASSNATSVRRVALVRVLDAEGAYGWGECAALPQDGYTAETAEGAFDVITQELIPLLGSDATADAVADDLRGVKGNSMAKAAVEMAVLDGEMRRHGLTFADRFGAGRPTVESGVSIGFAPSLDHLLAEVGGYVDAGYRRVKLKIEPGRDVAVVAAIRAQHPDIPLQVDANGAYTMADVEHLAGLDEFGLLLVEQPLAEDDLAGHAALAARLDTPICLDESLTSLAATTAAIDAGACEVVNLKPGRVGGYLEALRIHDLCVERGVPLWLGGMLETAVARTANLRLAALPGFTLPPDLSASARYFPLDVAAPIELGPDGRIAVPQGPGLAAQPDPDVLDRFTVRRLTR